MLPGLLLLLLLIFLIGVILGLLLALRLRPLQPPPPHRPPPSHKVPDHFDERALTSTLIPRLTGTTADGSRAAGPAPAGGVVWVDGGDEILVHLDAARVRILDRTLLVSVDLESDQTGRTPLTVVLALGSATDPSGLVATTDEFPRGHGPLAARWGSALQAAVWSSLMGLSRDHAAERGKAPHGISVSRGLLTLHADRPLVALAPGAHP
jgi:hypothetical protein